jgi:GNAT superfamily N-acetyltransferase
MLRTAQIDDIDALIEMGKAMYEESDLKSLSFNEAKAREKMLNVINEEFAVVYEVNNKIIGMMGAWLYQHIFSDDLIAMDYLFYVKPRYRGCAAAAMMAQAFIDWAVLQGVQPANIMVGVNAGINGNKAVEFWERIGFVRSGVNLRFGGN